MQPGGHATGTGRATGAQPGGQLTGAGTPGATGTTGATGLGATIGFLAFLLPISIDNFTFNSNNFLFLLNLFDDFKLKICSLFILVKFLHLKKFYLKIFTPFLFLMIFFILFSRCFLRINLIRYLFKTIKHFGSYCFK